MSGSIAFEVLGVSLNPVKLCCAEQGDFMLKSSGNRGMVPHGRAADGYFMPMLIHLDGKRRNRRTNGDVPCVKNILTTTCQLLE